MTQSAKFSKLHLGCGPKHIPGFFHIDGLDFPHVDHVGAVDDLDFIPDDSVDLIFASHLLEHFGRKEYKSILASWFRPLKTGGVLRLGVPDFRAVARAYLDAKFECSLEHITGLLVGGQKDQYDFHKMVFDEVSLTTTLKDIGFSEIRHWDWRTTEHAHIDDFSQAYLPHMDKENGRLMSLNLEAIK